MQRVPLSRRIIIARQHAGFESAKQLAKAVTELTGNEFTLEQAEALETGRAKRSTRVIHIALACGVSPDWLTLGAGPMIDGGNESDLPTSEIDLSEDEHDLIYRWRHLPLDVRPAVLTIIGQMDINRISRAVKLTGSSKRGGSRAYILLRLTWPPTATR